MKKILLTSVIIIISLLVNCSVSIGQEDNFETTASKKPLFEVFTSSTCIPCAAFVPILEEVLHDNEGQYTVIKYQMDWPPPGDIYYTEEGGIRRDYYGIQAIPELFVNGNPESVSGFEQEDFDDYVAETTELDITCSAVIDEDSELTIVLQIDAYDDFEEGLKLHIVVTEETTVNNIGTNGEIQFHDVMMDMFPNGEGLTLETLQAGGQITYSETIDMTQTNMEQATDLHIVAFIQDDNDKTVHQSAVSEVEYTFDVYAIQFNVSDNLGNIVENAQVYLSDVGYLNTDETGHCIYDELLPGNYDYASGAPGLFDTTGMLVIVASNIDTEIILHNPQALIYENFFYEIQESWTQVKTYPNYISWESGRVKMGRKLGQLDTDLMLISSEIDLSKAGMFSLELGEKTGDVTLFVGTVDDPETPEDFSELVSFVLTAEWEEVYYDFSDYTGTDTYFAIKFEGGQYTECFIDNIFLEDKTVGIHQNSTTKLVIYPNPVKDILKVELNMNAEVHLFNSVGKLVKHQKLNAGSTQMDLSNEVTGVYYLRILGVTGTTTRKIIVK